MNKLAEVLKKHESDILQRWQHSLRETSRRDRVGATEAQEQGAELLRRITAASQTGNLTDLNAAQWGPARELLHNFSSSQAKLGFTSSESATFVLSLKEPIFQSIRKELAKDPDSQFEEVWAATLLLDKLALITTESFIIAKEQMIVRQQEELLELSTPVIKLWDGILALPMIGTLDSARTQVVMESLLRAIVDTNSKIAIIDITGVPTVDTLVAQHLLKTITAARLMGAECIISGIRPQIAQTIVHLGIELTAVTTKAKLADAFSLALSKSGRTVVKAGAKNGAASLEA